MKLEEKPKYIALFRYWDSSYILTDNSDLTVKQHVCFPFKKLFNTREELFAYITDAHRGFIETFEESLPFHMYRPANAENPNRFFIEWLSDIHDPGLYPDEEEIKLWKENKYPLSLNTIAVDIYKLEEVTEIE